MIKYKFNKYYDTFFRRNELSIEVEGDFGGLYELAYLGGVDGIRDFINFIKKNIADKTPDFSQSWGFEQVIIFVGGKMSKYGFNFDTEHYQEYEFPTTELLKLLEDWLVFQIENKD